MLSTTCYENFILTYTAGFVRSADFWLLIRPASRADRAPCFQGSPKCFRCLKSKVNAAANSQNMFLLPSPLPRFPILISYKCRTVLSNTVFLSVSNPSLSFVLEMPPAWRKCSDDLSDQSVRTWSWRPNVNSSTGLSIYWVKTLELFARDST